MVVKSLYRSAEGRDLIRGWCLEQIEAWPVPHTRTVLSTSVGGTHIVKTGEGPTQVVLVPGTNFNAATSLPLATVLAQRWSTMVVDVPGQPGLSAGDRPRGDRTAWYATALRETLAAAGVEDVIVVGVSLGAAIALACDSTRIAGRVLYSPGGLVGLKVDPAMALASTRWLLRPNAARTRRMLELFVAPEHEPPAHLVEWMTLMAAHCRSTLAPPPLPADLVAARCARPFVAATGQYDRFLPPARLAPAVRRHGGASLTVLPGVGHLACDERPQDAIGLVEKLIGQIGPRS